MSGRTQPFTRGVLQPLAQPRGSQWSGSSPSQALRVQSRKTSPQRLSLGPTLLLSFSKVGPEPWLMLLRELSTSL